jgi:threonine/homoserine/homoserine lactone efflux protein
MGAEIFAELLVPAVGIGLSPIPIIAITLILGTARARQNGLAFLGAWLTALAFLCGLLFVFVEGLDDLGGSGTVMSSLRIVLGIGLLWLAFQKWQKRKEMGEDVQVPKWMETLNEAKPGLAAKMGALLGGVNPKNIAFSAVAASAIAQSQLGPTQQWLALLFFVILSSLTMILAVGYYWVGKERAEEQLLKVKEFMVRHNLVIMMGLYIIFGVMLLSKGITGLVG